MTDGRNNSASGSPILDSTSGIESVSLILHRDETICCWSAY